MTALRFETAIDQKGIFIPYEQLIKIASKYVEIIVMPSKDDSGRKSFMDYFASDKNDDTMIIENAISECRKVDLDGWK
ncbi:MAG: hypothetical protein RL154_819 [Pseudomonadota bacterium]